MATAYKVLGQASPGGLAQTTIYTCPASTQTVVSTISICNRSSSDLSFRLAVRPNGETLENKHYVVHDSPISANNIIAITIGITLGAGDVIECYASGGDLSFSCFGSEIT